MKIVVFGATSNLGKEIIRQAIETGHYVTAFVRNPEGLINKDNCNLLRIVRGNILNYVAVERAVRGQDVVLSTLDGGMKRKGTRLSEGAKNIVAAMKKYNVKKLISISAIDLTGMKGYQNWFYRRFVIPLLIRGLNKDKETHERHIIGSDLEWIIIRPGLMVDGPRTGSYSSRLGNDSGTVRSAISRADVADFALKQIRDSSYVRQTMEVSY